MEEEGITHLRNTAERQETQGLRKSNDSDCHWASRCHQALPRVRAHFLDTGEKNHPEFSPLGRKKEFLRIP